MDMVIGISIIVVGVILFFLTLTPTIMGLASHDANFFFLLLVGLIGFGLPIGMIWLGWSVIQGDPIVPIWVGLIPAAAMLGWTAWLFWLQDIFEDRFGDQDLNPRSKDYKKSTILQITPSDLSKIIHERAAINPRLSKLEDRKEIMAIIDHAVIIAKAIQQNDPDFRLPHDKHWPYSMDGIKEIIFVLTGLYLDKFHEQTQATRNDILSRAKESVGKIDSNENTSIAQAIVFFSDDSNALTDHQKKSLRHNIGQFLRLVKDHIR